VREKHIQEKAFALKEWVIGIYIIANKTKRLYQRILLKSQTPYIVLLSNKSWVMGIIQFF